MALSSLDRARVILDLVKDGDVASEVAYANVDKAGAVLGDKYCKALYALYGPINDESGDAIDFDDLTNMQKGDFYIKQLREWHRNVFLGYRLPTARNTAEATERAIVLGEIDTDLGVDS